MNAGRARDMCPTFQTPGGDALQDVSPCCTVGPALAVARSVSTREGVHHHCPFGLSPMTARSIRSSRAAIRQHEMQHQHRIATLVEAPMHRVRCVSARQRAR
jgi:hypothetical protein